MKIITTIAIMIIKMIVIMIMIMILNVSNNYINLICNIGFRYGPCSGVKDMHIHIM